jgi:hypothetical protein
MKKIVTLAVVVAFAGTTVFAQTKPAAAPTPAKPAQTAQAPAPKKDAAKTTKTMKHSKHHKSEGMKKADTPK